MRNQTRASYDFLQEKARSQGSFTLEELATSSGWTIKTTAIYKTKKFSEILKKDGNSYYVKRKFLGVSYSRYESLFKQKRKMFVEYEEHINPDVIIYEFFLPLSLEHVLRQSLDELFFKDTVKNRLEQIGIEKISEIFERGSTESDSNLLDRVCELSNCS